MIQLNKEETLIDGITTAYNKSRENQSSILFAYSFRFEIRDLLPLLTHPSDRNTIRMYWEQPAKGFAFAGLGSVLQIKCKNKSLTSDVIIKIKNTMNEMVSISDNVLVGPRLVGGYSFNQYKGDDVTWGNFPKFHFNLPECLATLTDDGAWLTISKNILPDDKLDTVINNFKRTKIYYENRLPVTLPPISRVAVDKFKDIPQKDSYYNTIFSVLGKIKPEKLEKVVISRSHHVKVGKEFSGVSAMQILRNAYPNCTTFLFAFPKEGIFFGSTPERLISSKNNFIKTEALAGTIARGNNMEEDRILAEKLMSSHKEREEHNLVLEQIIRKLEKITPNLEYSSNPDILKLKNVQHLHTKINGKITNYEHILNLVNYLHPTSAVAGTPTDKAMEVINEMETHDRGWYSGPIGWIDKEGDGEFYVALRSALVKNDEAHVFSGGGIVSESHPKTEWEETELKLQPIISALSGGQI